jgi:hypothetical protein
MVVLSIMPAFRRWRQEDHNSKPAWENSLRDLISKKTHHINRLVEWFKV